MPPRRSRKKAVVSNSDSDDDFGDVENLDDVLFPTTSRQTRGGGDKKKGKKSGRGKGNASSSDGDLVSYDDLDDLLGDDDSDDSSRGKKVAKPAKALGRLSKGKKKAALSESSDGEQSSDDNMDDYGFYGEEDRVRLEGMAEIERESILAERFEERRQRRERRDLREKAAAKDRKLKGARGRSAWEKKREDEGFSPSDAKRRKVGGDDVAATSGSRLDKARHASMGEAAAKKKEDADRRRREEHEKREKLLSASGGLTEYAPEFFREVQITRNDIEKFIDEPHFEESLQGAFVRVILSGAPLPGNDVGKAMPPSRTYRMVRIIGVREMRDGQPYAISNTSSRKTSKILTVTHGGAQKKAFRLCHVSNGEFTKAEVLFWCAAMREGSLAFPSKYELDNKKKEILQARAYKMTEEDVSRQLDAKGALLGGKLSIVRNKILRLLVDAKEKDDNQKIEKYSQELSIVDSKLLNEKEKLSASTQSARNVASVNLRNKLANLEVLKEAGERSKKKLNEVTEDSLSDPFARRPTRPKVYWDTSNERMREAAAQVNSPKAPPLVEAKVEPPSQASPWGERINPFGGPASPLDASFEERRRLWGGEDEGVDAELSLQALDVDLTAIAAAAHMEPSKMDDKFFWRGGLSCVAPLGEQESPVDVASLCGRAVPSARTISIDDYFRKLDQQDQSGA